MYEYDADSIVIGALIDKNRSISLDLEKHSGKSSMMFDVIQDMSNEFKIDFARKIYISSFDSAMWGENGGFEYAYSLIKSFKELADEKVFAESMDDYLWRLDSIITELLEYGGIVNNDILIGIEPDDYIKKD